MKLKTCFRKETMKMKDNNKLNVEVLLMQPNEIPHELLSSLVRFFRNSSNVNKAYFSVAQFSNSFDSTDFLIAVDSDMDVCSEIDKIKKYLSEISPDTDRKKVVIVDVSQSPFNNYFSKIRPFYEI